MFEVLRYDVIPAVAEVGADRVLFAGILNGSKHGTWEVDVTGYGRPVRYYEEVDAAVNAGFAMWGHYHPDAVTAAHELKTRTAAIRRRQREAIKAAW